MFHTKWWFLLLNSIALLNKSTSFILPVSEEESSTEIYNETSTLTTILSTTDTFENSTNFTPKTDPVEILSTTEELIVLETTTEFSQYVDDTTNGTIISYSTLFVDENLENTTITSTTTTTPTTTTSTITTPTTTTTTTTEKTITSPSIIMPKETTSDNIIYTTLLEDEIVFSSTSPKYITITHPNEYIDGENVDNILKEKNISLDDDFMEEISKPEPVTRSIDLYPSNEDDQVIWYPVESSTTYFSGYDTTTSPSITYTMTPYIDIPPVVEISTVNPYWENTITESISTTARVWYIMDDFGVRPYTGYIPDSEETTSSPIVSTTLADQKTSYCFYSNDGSDLNKYCVYGCNCNENKLQNFFSTSICRPTCYYTAMTPSNNFEPKCWNIKTNDADLQPLCCYRQYYSEEPNNQRILPSNCYEFQFSYPLSTFYYKCN